jgi:hypothetical protein
MFFGLSRLEAAPTFLLLVISLFVNWFTLIGHLSLVDRADPAISGTGTDRLSSNSFPLPQPLTVTYSPSPPFTGEEGWVRGVKSIKICMMKPYLDIVDKKGAGRNR